MGRHEAFPRRPRTSNWWLMALWLCEFQGARKHECTIGAVIREMLPVGVLQCNCSIFSDELTREALVADPGDNIAEILAI